MLTTRCGPTVPALQWPRVGSTGVAIDLAVSELKPTDIVCGRRQSGRGPAWRVLEDELSGAPRGGCVAGVGANSRQPFHREQFARRGPWGPFLHVNANTFTLGTRPRPVFDQVFGGERKHLKQQHQQHSKLAKLENGSAV